MKKRQDRKREPMNSHDLGTLLLGNPQVPLVLIPRTGTEGWFMAVPLSFLAPYAGARLDEGPVPAVGEDLDGLRARVIAPEDGNGL